MTPEQRLDRLERIAKLFVKAGLRGRKQMREMDEKINMLIESQIRTDERFARMDERMAQDRAEWAEWRRELAESQARADRKFEDLLRGLREGRNGRFSN